MPFRSLSPLFVIAIVAIVCRAETPVRFNSDIRPILSENCYFCHGPDDEARQAGLRLDTQSGATDYAITPGNAQQSEVYQRIISDDPDMVMPPPGSERSLTKQQIELLKAWMDQGASYQVHWSFTKPQRAEIPPSPPELGPRGAIDHYIHAELVEQKLSVAPEADRETLIRRATYDLLGIPPSIEEIDSFLADPSEQAYEHLIDRLLERKEYGERMASDWLDVARYSDSYGYQVDRDRYVWPYRDWLITAFNQNMPYDQFITAQLAGDLMPDATDDQILATTFNRLHPQKVEGGSVPEEFRIEYICDRTQTVATGMMGLTMECCRCHNHKYDPLSQKEFFELSAFFDNIDEAGLYSFFTSSIPTPALALPTPTQKKQLADAQQATHEAVANLGTTRLQQQTLASEWSAAVSVATEIEVAKPIRSLDFEEAPKSPNQQVEGRIGKAVKLTGDDAISTDVGNFHRYDRFSISCWIRTPDEKERAVIFHRSRAWTDAASRGYELLIENGALQWSLIHFWPGNAISIRTCDPIATNQWLHVVVTNDGSSQAAGLAIFIDGQRAKTEVVRDSLSKMITGGGGDTITIGERFRDRGFTGGLVDQFDVFDCQLTELEIHRLWQLDSEQSDASSEQAADSSDAEPIGDDADETQEAKQPLSPRVYQDHYLDRIDESVAKQRELVQRSQQAICKLQDSIQEIMVMRELREPRPSHLLIRGSYDQPGEQVHPNTPAVLPPFPEQAPRNRLGLAQWLVDPEHPLTSRVAVNRLWQIAFGDGLVRTTEDFGSQGAPPTHPELLDYLALELIESDWDIKRMLKQIMMSATYRRSSSHPDPPIHQRDPENLWLARFPSYRLPAEMLRDGVLAISGQLVPTIGGPPVKPYEIEQSFKPSSRSTGESLYRRSLYTYWNRTSPAPAMIVLDAAKRDVCQVKRERTSSPMQAFVLLNGPQYVEAARMAAAQLIERHDENRDHILIDAFRLTTSRKPKPDQLETLRALYQTQQRYFSEDPPRASEFLAIGEAKADPSIDQTALAATAVVVGVLFNFDFSVMKR